MMNGAGRLRRIFRYKVFVDVLFHAEVMSIFNLPIDKCYFTLHYKLSVSWLTVQTIFSKSVNYVVNLP